MVDWFCISVDKLVKEFSIESKCLLIFCCSVRVGIFTFRGRRCLGFISVFIPPFT